MEAKEPIYISHYSKGIIDILIKCGFTEKQAFTLSQLFETNCFLNIKYLEEKLDQISGEKE